MTETASRPGTTPAVTTLTAPETAGRRPGRPGADARRHGLGPCRCPRPHPRRMPCTTATRRSTSSTGARCRRRSKRPRRIQPRSRSWPAITTPEKALPKVTSFGPPGKHRSTIAIVVLSIVTLGMYSLVWHHRINREVGNFDTRMHVIPGRSTLAVTIPWALGWLVSIAGAVRIVLAVANVTPAVRPALHRCCRHTRCSADSC